MGILWSAATRAAVAAAIVLGGAAAVAADSPPGAEQGEYSKDTRERMAQLNERMAACLRSDTPVADCDKQIARACQEQLGHSDCLFGTRTGMNTRNRMQPHSSSVPASGQ